MMKMKKPVKFGGRRRYNGEDESLVAASKAEGERSSDEPLEQVSKMAQKKKSVVTKEEMQKAGFDNLRDYLNAQRGLTRRGEKSTTSKSAESEPKSAAKTESASIEVRASRPPRSTDDDSSSVFAPRAKEAIAKAKERLTSGREFSSKPAESKTSRSEEDSSVLAPGAREFMGRLKNRLTSGYEFGKKHGGKVHKYAAGGKVGSASKRADGIAKKGKTRGMMR
jgi:hypothetical protein